MAQHTLTFDEKVNGWTSFHTYYPEYMVEMNNQFYTFKDGQLYKHNVDSGDRNTYYGEAGNSSIEFVVNDSPSDVKNLRALSLESNNKTWSATIETDIEKGHIDKSSFENKEGINYAYIRRNADADVDTTLLSVQGVGVLDAISENVLTFDNVPGTVSVSDGIPQMGDILYFINNLGEQKKIGRIESKTSVRITVESQENTPSLNDFCFAVKNSIAESFSLKGYFAKVKLTSESTDPCELFAVNTELDKSFP